jgi:hypothetical protein
MISTHTTSATGTNRDRDILPRGHAVVAVIDQTAGSATTAAICGNRRTATTTTTCHY